MSAFSPPSPPVPTLPLVLLPLSRPFRVDFHFPASSRCFLLGPLEGAFPPGLRQAGPPLSHMGPDRTPRTAPPRSQPSLSPAAAVCFCQDRGKLAPCFLPLRARPWELLQPGSRSLSAPHPAPATLPGCSR